MFAPIKKASIADRFLPALLVGFLVLVALGVLIHFQLLPGEAWLVVLGPGLLLGWLAAPEGIHSDSPFLFFSLIVFGSLAWWGWIGRLIYRWFDRRREETAAKGQAPTAAPPQ